MLVHRRARRSQPLENDLLAADGALEADNLNPAPFNERPSRRFLGGDGALTPPIGERLVQEPTLRLVKLAKEAVHDLFQMHRDEVQVSWGTLLDQEEAIGYLISDVLALEIMPEEAPSLTSPRVTPTSSPPSSPPPTSSLPSSPSLSLSGVKLLARFRRTAPSQRRAQPYRSLDMSPLRCVPISTGP